jgi:formate hydrogenlyase subunit 6/NADH:ubiquinone oxidoreductase subunit I
MKLPFLKYAVKNVFSKPSTVGWPAKKGEAAPVAKPEYRGRISYDAAKCVNCGMCIRVCSPGAITRVVKPVEEGDEITYTFDLTSCTFCATCVDFCGTKAIQMTDDYHMVGTKHEDFLVTGTRVKKKTKGFPECDQEVCVYCGLCQKNCPEGAIVVDRPNKTWTLDKKECVQCGICIQKCPKKCLKFGVPGAKK